MGKGRVRRSQGNQGSGPSVSSAEAGVGCSLIRGSGALCREMGREISRIHSMSEVRGGSMISFSGIVAIPGRRCRR